MKEVTLVIPAKDEAECLPIVLKELKNFDCKKTCHYSQNRFKYTKRCKKFRL